MIQCCLCPWNETLPLFAAALFQRPGVSRFGFGLVDPDTLEVHLRGWYLPKRQEAETNLGHTGEACRDFFDFFTRRAADHGWIFCVGIFNFGDWKYGEWVSAVDLISLILLHFLCTSLTGTILPWHWHDVGFDGFASTASQISEFKMQNVSVVLTSIVILIQEKHYLVTESWCSIPLKKWFGKEEDLHDEHLETFNQLVHKDLAPQVLQSVCERCLALQLQFLGKEDEHILVFWYLCLIVLLFVFCFNRCFSLWMKFSVTPFQDISVWGMYMVVVSCFPGLCSLIPRLVEGPPDTSGAILQQTIWVCREIMAWIFPGVVVLYALRLSTRFWLIAVRLSPKGSPDLRHRLFYSLLMPIPMSCMLLWLMFLVLLCLVEYVGWMITGGNSLRNAGCWLLKDVALLNHKSKVASQWFSFQLALSQSEHDSLLPAIPFLAWVLLLYCIWTWGTPVATKTPRSWEAM